MGCCLGGGCAHWQRILGFKRIFHTFVLLGNDNGFFSSKLLCHRPYKWVVGCWRILLPFGPFKANIFWVKLFFYNHLLSLQFELMSAGSGQGF